ncbi:MAG TPA: OmpA family protein [Gemmatimonadales bacterium]|jgi:outer membrane protein OmpA-like peptidoglycan-associated protein|nr:OmpA family protein [Gemmatimonadales bacterium]
MKHFGIVAAFATLVLATPAAAQRGGSVELLGYGAYPHLDESYQFNNKFGFGGQLGLYIANNVSLDADVTRYSGHSEVGVQPEYSVMPMRARLTFHVPIGGYSRFQLGLGYVRTRLGGDFPVNNESGATALAGFKIGMGEHVSLHVEGTFDYLFDALNQDPTVSHNINYGARAGLSLLFGGYGPKDKDGDGVLDAADLCPDTPKGEAVDSNGCPDTDKDGVRDNVDRCPNTPGGTRVDSTGCPIKDSDKDGVLDDTDKCPNTPAGTQVDSTGCTLVLDADKDGVVDKDDRCPNTAAGTRVDSTGCPIDSDGDGVTDAADRCPNTPRGTKVDGNGCPAVDTDGDGVLDSADRCPDTPKGMLVSANGCLILFVEGKKNVVLQGVNFVVNKAELTIDAKKILDFVAQSLNANAEVTFEVQGHASSEGSDSYNMNLSQRRAESVRAYLISKGVAASRMTAKGYGETMPIADNATEDGRKQNRRVELVRTDGGN